MKRPADGYTLIECVLALGFVALGLMAVVAVLPMGLSPLAAGGRRVAEARIMQTLEARCRAGRVAGEYYFSTGGVPLEDSRNAAFVAKVAVPSPLFLPGDVEGFLQCVKVTVTDHPHSQASAEGFHATEHSLIFSSALDSGNGS
ncbi:MAG: hypothetical protein JWO94_3186 [Verrucomicrobiaceae bacterium]|nr:hypothetical protein [Verrucomicrobiaceae bacterium]